MYTDIFSTKRGYDYEHCMDVIHLYVRIYMPEFDRKTNIEVDSIGVALHPDENQEDDLYDLPMESTIYKELSSYIRSDIIIYGIAAMSMKCGISKLFVVYEDDDNISKKPVLELAKIVKGTDRKINVNCVKISDLLTVSIK